VDPVTKAVLPLSMKVLHMNYDVPTALILYPFSYLPDPT
jgi:hypothetical protein